MADIEKITLKNGEIRYGFQVYVGVNPKTGKQATTERRFKTKREANIALKRIESQAAEGTYFLDKKSTPKNLTFEDVYLEWFNKEYIRSVSESTLLVTKRVFENRILPEIGNYKLEKITLDDIQKLADDWGSHQSCKKWINFIKRVFRFAHSKEYTRNDPCKFVIIPEPTKSKSTKIFYETDELRQFIETLEESENIAKQTFLRILFFTGMRRGEVLALKWKYVNFENKTIHVEHSTERVENPDTGKSYMRIGPPKNNASYRTISIDDKTLKLLNDMYEYRISELVFTSQNGGLLSDAKPRKWLRAIANKAGLEPIKVHAARHTHASLLFEAGATVKDVQLRLGHEDVQTTMNIYTHVTKKSTERMAQKFSDYVEF